MNDIISLINNVGFPIVACIYLAREVKELRKTVENNTSVMVALCSKLGINVELKEN